MSFPSWKQLVASHHSCKSNSTPLPCCVAPAYLTTSSLASAAFTLLCSYWPCCSFIKAPGFAFAPGFFPLSHKPLLQMVTWFASSLPSSLSSNITASQRPFFTFKLKQDLPSFSTYFLALLCISSQEFVSCSFRIATELSAVMERLYKILCCSVE